MLPAKRQRRDPNEDWEQLRMLVATPAQEAYELLRPHPQAGTRLFGRTPAERANETAMRRTLAADTPISRRWVWLWGGVHLTVGALGPVALLLAQAYLRGDSTVPLNAERFVAGLYASLAVLLAGLTLLGVAQWLLLRRVFVRLRWWWAVLTVGAGVIGGGCVLYIAWAQDYGRSLGNDMALYAIIFAIIGAAQWLELRRAAPQAGWWIIASVLGDVALWLTYAAVATVGPVSAAVVRARDVRPAVVLALAVQGGSSFLAYAAVMALAIWSIRSPTARQAGVRQRRFLRPLRSR